jgi:hypothetical protein
VRSAQDVLWDNLGKAQRRNLVMRAIVIVAVIMLVLFWTIPVAFVSRCEGCAHAAVVHTCRHLVCDMMSRPA